MKGFTQRIEISTRTIVFTVLFLLSLQVLWLIRELLFALFLAFILMSALKPLVNRLEKRKVPRPIAAVTVFFTSIFGLVFLLAFVLPPIVSETIEFFTNLPLILMNSFPFLSGYLNFDSAIQLFPNITGNFIRVASGVFSNVLFLISIFFFTFYFLLEERFLESFISKFFDKKAAEEIHIIISKTERRLGAWMRGEIILMTVIGLLTYIGLSLFNIQYALSLAVVAGLLEIVPIIGPIISAIPAFLVASSSSLFLGGTVILLYLVIQQLENNVIVPYVMSKTVGIHPIVTLGALSIGGTLGGLIGAILGVPVALVVETIILELSHRSK